jgi:hypothetical protein
MTASEGNNRKEEFSVGGKKMLYSTKNYLGIFHLQKNNQSGETAWTNLVTVSFLMRNLLYLLIFVFS